MAEIIAGLSTVIILAKTDTFLRVFQASGMNRSGGLGTIDY
jgi:hypothetical protein